MFAYSWIAEAAEDLRARRNVGRYEPLANMPKQQVRYLWYHRFTMLGSTAMHKSIQPEAHFRPSP